MNSRISSILDNFETNSIVIDEETSVLLRGLILRIDNLENKLRTTNPSTDNSMFSITAGSNRLGKIETTLTSTIAETRLLAQQVQQSALTITDYANAVSGAITTNTGFLSDISGAVSSMLTATLNSNNEHTVKSTNRDATGLVTSWIEEGLDWFAAVAEIVPVIGPTVAGVAKLGSKVASAVSSLFDPQSRIEWESALDLAPKVVGSIAELLGLKNKQSGLPSSANELSYASKLVEANMINAFKQGNYLITSNAQEGPVIKIYTRFLNNNDVLKYFSTSGGRDYSVLIDEDLSIPAASILEFSTPWTDPNAASANIKITMLLGNYDYTKKRLDDFMLNDGINIVSSCSFDYYDAVTKSYGSIFPWQPINMDGFVLTDELYQVSMSYSLMYQMIIALSKCDKRTYNSKNFNSEIHAREIAEMMSTGKMNNLMSGKCASDILSSMGKDISIYNNIGTVTTLGVITAGTTGYATIDNRVGPLTTALNLITDPGLLTFKNFANVAFDTFITNDRDSTLRKWYNTALNGFDLTA